MNKRRIIWGSLILVPLVVEISLRQFWGLCDPPLLVPDATIDYIFAPNQKCSRFGNQIIYNDASMRCDFGVTQYRPSKYRIFVVGDSVINGGVLTDHNELATTMLQEKIDSSRKVIQVCNVSAGSWGPGNYCAYFDKYRDLVAQEDVLVLEVNSHDLWEDPPDKNPGALVGSSAAYPDRKPFCAMWECVNRYLIPRIKRKISKDRINKIDVPHHAGDETNDVARYNLDKIRHLFELPWRKKILLIHRSREEALASEDSLGEIKIRELADEMHVPVVLLILSPLEDYRDIIHPNLSGQRKIFEKLEEVYEDCK